MSNSNARAGVVKDPGQFNSGKRNIKAVYTNPKLTVGAKAVYGVFCSYADKDLVCYPSVNRIATDLDKSTRQVNRWIQELVDAGIIYRYWADSKSIHTKIII